MPYAYTTIALSSMVEHLLCIARTSCGQDHRFLAGFLKRYAADNIKPSRMLPNYPHSRLDCNRKSNAAGVTATVAVTPAKGGAAAPPFGLGRIGAGAVITKEEYDAWKASFSGVAYGLVSL